MKYHVYRVEPGGYIHADGLSELADTVRYGLERMGAEVTQGKDYLPGVTNIIIGGHLISHLPPRSIVYNSEVVTDDSTWMAGSYKHLLLSHEVWDYSERNVEKLAALGIKARFVPLGYVSEMTRIQPTEQDIDVLFYGSMNPRREKIIRELATLGYAVKAVFGLYGAERDALIARSKIVLNMHFYESHVFEIVRVSYLLSNRKAVVAECDPDTAIEDALRDCVAGVPYEGLTLACVKLLADPDLRLELEDRGFNLFSRRREEDILREALRPRTLNVGSGKDFRPDCINIDINPDKYSDAMVNIAVLPLWAETDRFGKVEFSEGSFDTIIANDVLEHIPDLSAAMTNCLRLLTLGGEMQIYVPYDLSLGAWQDPTHVRGFNEMSWAYYTDWYWYMGWTTHRFDVTKCELVASAYGQELQREGAEMHQLMRTPRAIEAMRVVLKKRLVNDPTLIEGVELKKPAKYVRFDIIVPVNDEWQFKNNLLASPDLTNVIPVRGATSAADAFIQGREQSEAEWFLFCHQDVYWPKGSLESIQAEIAGSKAKVIGFAGMNEDEKVGFVVDRGRRFDHLNRTSLSPTSIDEFAVVLHRDVHLDPALGWHLWATDLALEENGRIIRVPCYHNSQTPWIAPPAFWESGKKLLAKHDLKRLNTLCGELKA